MRNIFKNKLCFKQGLQRYAPTIPPLIPPLHKGGSIGELPRLYNMRAIKNRGKGRATRFCKQHLCAVCALGDEQTQKQGVCGARARRNFSARRARCWLPKITEFVVRHQHEKFVNPFSYYLSKSQSFRRTPPLLSNFLRQGRRRARECCSPCTWSRRWCPSPLFRF